MKPTLHVIAALVLVVGTAGAADAKNKIRVDGPLSVTDQTVREPVQGLVRTRLLPDESLADLDLITPPEGKMVVIEYVTIRVFAREETANALVSLFGSLGADFVAHYLDAFPPPVSVGVVSTYQQTLTQDVLMYSTGPVTLRINRGQLDGVTADYDASFSGYLVDASETD